MAQYESFMSGELEKINKDKTPEQIKKEKEEREAKLRMDKEDEVRQKFNEDMANEEIAA